MENPIIAVFTETQKEFDSMELRPKKLFRRIIDIRDVRASNVIGIIECNLWWGYRNPNNEMRESHEYLKYRFPHLFEEK